MHALRNGGMHSLLFLCAEAAAEVAAAAKTVAETKGKSTETRLRLPDDARASLLVSAPSPHPTLPSAATQIVGDVLDMLRTRRVEWSHGQGKSRYVALVFVTCAPLEQKTEPKSTSYIMDVFAFSARQTQAGPRR